ncbi:MAG: hypothetical protein LAO20_08445 [Acidobacteriia bacterium]|nr:hypothetical protein [Terriglobia bacterium]
MKTIRRMLNVLLLISIAFLISRREAFFAVPSAANPQPEGTRRVSTATGSAHRLAESLQSKLDRIQENGAKPHPLQTPTIMTEEEINDYLASDYVELPKGIEKVTFQGRSGLVTAFLKVDFDKVREGQRSSNPLLAMFSGTHNVVVESDAAGSGGQGKTHVRTVTLDGVEVPRMALQFFADRYITSKHPDLGLDSQFQLPDRIDAATVGYHKLTVTQR